MAISSRRIQIGLLLRLVQHFDLANSLFRSFELAAIKEVLQQIEIKGTVLDIGCAEGYIAREVFRNKNVIGLDYELNYLLDAQELRFYKYLVNADARKMPFKDSTFSFLFSNSAIEHIKELEDVLKEVNRILKNGGLFLFTVPNENFAENLFFYKALKLLGLNKLALSYSRERNKRLSHFHMYSEESWYRILQEYGLRTIQVRSYISRNTLMLWDILAVSQFILRKVFGVFLKIPIIKRVLLFITYLLELLGVFIFLLFLPLIDKKEEVGKCATLLVISK